MMLKKDFVLNWKDWKGVDSSHRIRIFERGNSTSCGQKSVGMPKQTVVIITEEADAEGVSVTNGCETIATLLTEQQKFDRNSTVFVEHYEEQGEFSLITFMWDDRQKRFLKPAWQYQTRQQIETLIGTILE